MIPLLVSFLIFAFTMTPEIHMVIVTNIVILAGVVGKLAWDIHLGRKAKVQRELDLAAAAAERESAAKEREQTRLDQLQQREQDRLDPESKARILQAEVINQARLIAAEGAKRESRIVEKIDENTAMNAEQIKISNGRRPGGARDALRFDGMADPLDTPETFIVRPESMGQFGPHSEFYPTH